MDIVERIRTRLNDVPLSIEFLLDEAADEIERLRLELSEAKISLETSEDWY